MNNKRPGGQPKHWAERAKLYAWYYEIKSRCDWSDHVLDWEFAWKDKSQRHKLERPRYFEAIRMRAREPHGQHGDQLWHDMAGLVSAVDDHPLFRGTKDLFNAEIWQIMQQPTFSSDQIQRDISNCLEKFGLIRLNPNQNEVISALLTKYSAGTIFQSCLNVSLQKVDQYSGLALMWLLYIQNEPARNWQVRSMLEDMIDKALDIFFYDHFPTEEYRDYYPTAIETLQRSRLKLTNNAMGYGFNTDAVSWPIFPKELISSLPSLLLFPLPTLLKSD